MISIIWAGYLFYNLKYIPNKQAKIQEEISIEQAKIEKQKEPKLTEQVIEKKELSNVEKIDELRSKNKYYKYFKLDNDLEAYFINNKGSLDLFYNKSKIANFSLVYSEYLNIFKIEWTQSDLFIRVWPDKYIFNSEMKNIQKIELNIDVEYVKVWADNKLIFVTEKGSFVYSINTKKLDYFSYFNDFVYFNDWYIWIVWNNEKRILNNLWFESEEENLVVYYNPNTKEKKIVYETTLDIKKIYINKEKIYLTTEEGLFELENIK